MFKFMKQGISLAAAVAAAGSCIPVYAAGMQPGTSIQASGSSGNTEAGNGKEGSSSSITIAGAVEGHRYKVYQVFKGKVSADGTKLSNVEYGANYSGREGVALKDELAQLEAEGADAKVFAETVKEFLTGEPAAVLSTENPAAELEAGYYLVMDESDGGAGDALSDYIVTVAGNVTVQPKSVGVPEFDKSIDDGKSQENTEKTHSISIEDTEPGHSCEIYQIFTGTAGNGGEIENLRYGTNYGTRGDAVPSDIISSIGTTDFEEHIKQELSGNPAAVLTSGDPAMGVEAGYYLAVDKDKNGKETGCEFAAVSGDKVISIKHEPKVIDLSPDTADIEWNYRLDKQNGIIYLNYYTGTKTDVKVYSHYKVPGDDTVYAACPLTNKQPTDFRCMFSRNENIRTVVFSDALDTSLCTGMACMFKSCRNLKSVDFGSGFDTSNVTSMCEMFYDCRSLVSLDISGFNTGSVTDMADMFGQCTSLTSLDLSSFDTSNVTGMSMMFCYCSSLSSLDVSGFDTSCTEDMRGMFYGCGALTNLDLTSFDTHNASMMYHMFRDCSKMKEIKVTDGKWDTSQAGTDLMFDNCGVSAVTPVTQSASAASALFPLSYAVENAENADSEDAAPDEYIEVEDDDTSVEYGIGDSIPYKLTATMPESITAYKKYQLAFHDRLSAGLDYDRDSLRVFAGDTEIPAEHYTITYSEDGKSMTVSIADVKAAPWNAVPGTQIIVKYSAVLNENAQAGNTNEAFLEYSNDPKGDGTGTTGPGVPDVVTVYTFELRFDKVDRNGNALEGAGFTLYKKNGAGGFVPAGDEIKGLTRFSFKGLAAGEYKLVETTTPDGYNTMEDLYFNIVAEEAESGGETVKRISIEAPDGSPLSGWTAIGADKAFESDIANYTGSTLPETGGAGTYLLYAAGVAVVITAGTVIAARKKADEE